MRNKQFTLNTAATLVNLIIQFSISFFLTSYLVNVVGSTAYGFYGMANTVVNYALIITTALNSLAARFIGIGVHNNNLEEAKKYYSSVFVGDLVFALIIFIPSCIAIYHLEHLINIPIELVSDVKLLFFIVFLNMCCNVVFAAFGCVYVIKNRLDISAMLQMISNIFKALMLIVLYACFKPSIVYLGTATFLATIVVAAGNMYFSNKLMPGVKLSFAFAKVKAVKEIVTSGIWNSINQLSVVLLGGLDLLIANLMVSAKAMGVLSIAGTIPGVITTCLSALSNLFTPKFLKCFSHNDFDGLLAEAKNSIRFMTVITITPMSFLIAFGMDFFRLWTPNTDLHMLYTLSLLVLVPQFSGGAINSMNYLYTVANKVKWQAIVLFLTGISNVIIVFTLLKFTGMGVYAIAGVSAVMGFMRNFLFNAPYAAYIIKKPLWTFWPDMLKACLCLVIASAIGGIVAHIFVLDSWIKLILIGGCCTVFSGAAAALIVLSKEQKQMLLSKVKQLGGALRGI